MASRIADSAQVDPRSRLGDGCAIWDLAQIREEAELGPGCVVGRGAYVGAGVRMGAHCKVQNYALVYEPAELADGVFVGPAAVLTNDTYPRAVNPDGSLKSGADWEPVGVRIGTGAAVGARAVCVAPASIGAWATVAAGAVVTRDVPDHALVAGVPARRIGWVGRAGVPLTPVGEGRWRCPATAEIYRERPDGRGLAGPEETPGARGDEPGEDRGDEPRDTPKDDAGGDRGPDPSGR